MRRLTVVQLLPALESGGVERSTLEIAEALVCAGHRAIVVSAGGRLVPALQQVGGEHLALDIGRKSPLTLRHVAALRRLFATERPDIVHARSRLPAWLGWLALRGIEDRNRPAFVTTVHGLNSPSPYSAVMTRGDRVICVSETVRDYVLQHYPQTDPGKLRVIPRGIDPSAFTRASRPDAAFRARIAAHEPALAGNAPLLLLPGRGTRLKGHADAVTLLAALRREGIDARLWMPGAREAGRERYVAELERQAATLGVGDALAITPPTTRIAEAYAASHLVLQLSRKPEAFGRTVVEALSVGRPVLGWAHGGVGELLRELQPQGAVSPFDAHALVVAAMTLLAQPPPPPATMPYTLHAMQDATLAVYDELAPPDTAGWRWAPVWILAFVALWPAPGYAEGVMVLGALAAIIKLVAGRFRGGTALLSGPAWALTSVLFFAYWLPELISSLDALDQGRALRESLVDLRYLPFLWLVASAVASERGRRITFGGLGIIVGIWTLDALLQAMSGTSPLFWGLDAIKQAISGKPMCAASDTAAVDRLSGFLGPCNLKLGLVLASLSPFALYAAGRRFGALGWCIAAAALGVVILLAGARASWLTFALVLLLTGWTLLGRKRLLGVFAFGVVALALAALAYPPLLNRIERTAAVFDGNETGIDQALSGRTQIWSAAACMVREHPVNGVGARGFREAFPQCDPKDGAGGVWGHGPALHAHQIVLEILSETGFIGLLLWLAGAALAFRAWRYASVRARENARPAMLALAVTVFPFNTHLAFYSTFWGGLTLLLAALYAGSLLAHEPR